MWYSRRPEPTPISPKYTPTSPTNPVQQTSGPPSISFATVAEYWLEEGLQTMAAPQAAGGPFIIWAVPHPSTAASSLDPVSLGFGFRRL